MISAILPADVIAVEAFDDDIPVELFPAEEELISKAVDKRRREFTTARRCARQALAELGYPPAPLLTGLRGAPVWPDGVVGSITHCAGYRAAVVASSTDRASVGIDAEPHEPLPEGVLGAVTVNGEEAAIGRLLSAIPGTRWDRLLFSAKESVYKAWFPLTRKWLDFQEAEITFDPAGTFHSNLLVEGPVVGGERLDGFDGRWSARGGLVLTAIAVAHMS